MLTLTVRTRQRILALIAAGMLIAAALAAGQPHAPMGVTDEGPLPFSTWST